MSLQRYGPNKDSFRVVIYAGTKPDGKPRQLTAKVGEAGITEREAKRLAPAVEAALRARVDAQQERAGTIAELADEWLALKEAQGRSPVTLAGYRHIIEHVTERFGTKPIDKLEGIDLDRWYIDLARQGRGDSTIAHYHAVMRAMLRQAVKWQRIRVAVTDFASPPQAPQPDIKPPTVAALAVALARIESGELRRMIEFAALTGIRRGELCGLMWADIDHETGVLRIERALKEVDGELVYGSLKSRKARRKLRLTDTAKLVLLEQATWLQEHVLDGKLDGAMPIFPSLRDDLSGRSPTRPSWLDRAWRSTRDRIGLPGVRIHDMRHLNTTTMLHEGVSVVQVAAIEGHSRPSITTDRYGHATNEAETAAMEVVERSIGAALRPRGELAS